MEDKLKRLKESMDESIFKENPVSQKNKERIFERIEKSEMNDGVKHSFVKWLRRGAMAIVGLFLVFFLWDTVGKEIINSPGNQQQDIPAVDQKENDSKVEQDDSKRKTLSFHGESENWNVQYKAVVYQEEKIALGSIGTETDYLTLQYIGDGQPPEEIDYEIKSGSGGNSGEDVVLENGVYDNNLGGCGSCAILTENSLINMTIEWGAKSENIRLVNGNFDDKKMSAFISEAFKILSEPLDDPRLEETNRDEGFEYYLKSRKISERLRTEVNFVADGFKEDYDNVFLLMAGISNLQFSRTTHLGENGEAIEATELADKWKPMDEEMKQAFDYLYQIFHDLDVAVNQNGEGETYGVTYFLNGDKASEIEEFLGQ